MKLGRVKTAISDIFVENSNRYGRNYYEPFVGIHMRLVPVSLTCMAIVHH